MHAGTAASNSWKVGPRITTTLKRSHFSGSCSFGLALPLVAALTKKVLSKKLNCNVIERLEGVLGNINHQPFFYNALTSKKHRDFFLTENNTFDNTRNADEYLDLSMVIVEADGPRRKDSKLSYIPKPNDHQV